MPIDAGFLARIKLFDQLDDDERSVLALAVTNRPVKTGELLFTDGEPGDSMFIVKEGAIEIYVKDTTGQKIVLHTAGPNDFFGELSLLDGGSRTASAAPIMDSELVVLDRADLLQLFEKRPHAALDMLSAMGGMTRRANALLRSRVAKNVNEEVAAKSSLLDAVADAIAAFSGSMAFLLLNAGWFVVWVAMNTFLGFDFDPYPFGLLTMIVSLEAIFLSCFVLLSQNIQASKDRVRADIEYDVNVKAELEVAHLHEKTDRLYEVVLERLAKIERNTARPSDSPRA